MLFSPKYMPLFREMPDTRYTLVKGAEVPASRMLSILLFARAHITTR